jgi:hypothetical protein
MIDDESDSPDNHSGTRLVLLLFLLPLTVFAGWVAWRVVTTLTELPLGHEGSRRAGMVGAGLAIAAVAIALLRFQEWFTPKAQSFSEEPIDAMSEDDQFDEDEDL